MRLWLSGKIGTREKIVTQPRKEGCDLAELGGGACEEDESWRGGGGATFPDRAVTQVSGHRESSIEPRSLGMAKAQITGLFGYYKIRT